MSIGMSYDEFWNQDVALVRVYRKADELKRRRQNEALWLQGMYIYEALCDAAPIFHAFAKKGTKPLPYSKEPYAITETEIRERNEREARLKEERMKAEFAAFAEQMRKKMPKEAHPGTKGGDMNVHND
jgi:hypothetical protein